MEDLITYDQQLFLYLNNLGTETWDTLWLLITNKFTFIPLYALLLFLLYKKFGIKSLLYFVPIIVLMVTFTDQITNVFKDAFQRLRPCGEKGVMEYARILTSYCGKYGFFSGHASNSMAAAVFAGLLLKPFYKNLIFILLFWSAMVAYSRIYVGVHYPLDILCGLTFGALTGFAFYKLSKYILNKVLKTRVIA